MTTTEPVWEDDDPFAGWELPASPAWLPAAGRAVREAVVASRVEAEAVAQPAAAAGGGGHGTPDAAEAGPADHLTKKSAAAPTAVRPPDGPSPAAPPLAVPEQPAPVPRPGATAQEFSDVDEPEENWGFVPLGITDPEAAHAAEPRYAHVEPDEFGEASAVFADDAPASPDGGGLPGQHWFEDDSRRRPLPLIALGASLLVLAVVLVFIVVGGGGGGNKSPAPGSSGPSLASQAMPTGAVGARPVPSEQLSELTPQDVAVGAFDGELQVTWDPPRSPQAVSGYFVVAQTPSGSVEERRLLEKDSLTVVFDDPKLCVVVTTVVSTLEGLQLARGELVCPTPVRTATRTPPHAT